jgi:23S rRNA (cytosine1962-C5)-methyltransferase
MTSNSPTSGPDKERREPRLRLRVTAAAESQLRSGHPWVYSESVREQNRDGRAGELAVVYDRRDRFLAIGLYDPESPIRVRLLHTGKPADLNPDWWRNHLNESIERRRRLFDDGTNGYRLINGESDRWPGLVLDRYDTTLVLKLYTAAWLPRLPEIAALLSEAIRPERLILRLSRNIARAAGPYEDGQVLFSRESDPSFDGRVVFVENGLRFEADVVRGQKTGFFLDQRENRREVESLSPRRRVLNAFSFSGGFSLYAARGGAVAVTNLDLSAHALKSAERNFALNDTDPSVARCEHAMIQADAFEWLDANAGRKFDLIVLDPPSFAKREAERAGAIQAYEKLASLGLRHLDPDGVLVACSCSAHVGAEEFFGAVRTAARKSRRQFEELKTTGHAPDHPASFREAEYLKGIYLRLL